MVDQWNIQAELMLFGCILLDNTIIKEIEVRPQHVSFYHQSILKGMLEIDRDGEEINRATLHEKLGNNLMAQWDIDRAIDSVPSPHSYALFEKIIFRTWKRNQVRRQAEKFLDKTKEATNDDHVSGFVKEVKLIEAVTTKKADFVLKDKLMDVYDEAVSGTVDQGLKSGYTEYDLLTNGHGKGQLIIVAARPSVGKTALAINMTMGHMENGGYGHLYSLEMSMKQLVNRMIACKARINSQKMRDPKRRFDEEDWTRYGNAMSLLSQQSLYICDESSVKVSEMYANTRKLISQHPDKHHFLIVDYLQLLQPISKKGNRQEQVTEISRALKTIARDLNIPVIALSQLSRGVETRQDKRPTLADLRESGSLEQDADTVALLYRDDYYDPAASTKKEMEIIIAKQREGPVGTITLTYEKEYSLFLNKEESPSGRGGDAL
ncbi:replicative DNA helicase [Alteribacter keqinensis]|uniref:replicative DNA helicase n=1 Tax=Alteribacter keqinensis TaxID=2483800 RepID=UPI00160685BC|nr:replicative DNA helicase [Alteribacter keqinensis]